MDIYGISNIKENELNFNYDKYYKQIALRLKEIKTDIERDKIRK